MTELDLVDSAKCPHCREAVSGEELMAMETSGMDETVLVCPECDTVLGGATGDGMFVSIVSVLLAESFDEGVEVAEAFEDLIRADSPDDFDDESLELINDRMGPTQVTID